MAHATVPKYRETQESTNHDKCDNMKHCTLLFYIASQLGPCFMQPEMKRTVSNSKYEGVLQAMSIPVDIRTDPRDNASYASFAGAVPIHRCTNEQVLSHAATTHHYAGVFTDQQLASLSELAYVRVDDNTVEKVFINRNKRILLLSSDTRLAQWRCAPTFESSNRFLAGTPVVSASGALLSIVTARRGNHYALSNIDGAGGYFETSEPWNMVPVPAGSLCYGRTTFPSRDLLRDYITSLPPGATSPPDSPVNFTPSLLVAPTPRVTLTADTGRQIAHIVLDGVIVKDVEYL